MDKSKRNLSIALGAIGGGTALVWQKPAVRAIGLPAHASTSCNAPEGCYEFAVQGPQHFNWAGGTGPATIATDSGLCSDTASPGSVDLTYVVASSEAEAETLLDCAGFTVELDITSGPDLPEGCSFFLCDAPT